jgi:hypothetical protein
VHDIISDIIDWDQANKMYTAGEGQSGERYLQRLEAADRMAEIEARWQHLPHGFHGKRKLIRIHIQAVAETAQVASKEDLCWLAIAAASAWLPMPEPADADGDEPPSPDDRGQDAAQCGDAGYQPRDVVIDHAALECPERAAQAPARFVAAAQDREMAPVQGHQG